MKVLSLILGGGKGTRLYPLTKERSKPAVPFAGKYRIVDIPISNCINSGFEQIYILTQFNSASLNMHISNSYNFDRFSRGFVEILAAEQTFEHTSWYEGTADAVRKNFIHFKTQKPTHYIILSGDQLFKMDLDAYMKQHIESGADITIATTKVSRREATEFGIMRIDENNKIVDFIEKPAADKDISDWRITENVQLNSHGEKCEYLASMGIYIFNADTMEKALDNNYTDFGKEVIPEQLKKSKVNAYIYDGYWSDIGTIQSYYEEAINLTTDSPKVDFYNEASPIYTHARNLPTTKIMNTVLTEVNTAEGCIIKNSKITSSVIGIRSVIRDNCELEGVLLMGADYYENDEQIKENEAKKIPSLGIGKNCKIKKAIIDKNARIGDNCSIGMNPGALKDGNYDNYSISDGIIVINKNAVLPAGTVI
ncbi:MAG: glucose-1-phosphate adenylyltransferase [Treponemataceae bacterium]|nr:glucose-1-phosphate adenylyltransferase [Spirochaetales bacterium]MDY6031677.1 glucose-1-phosphate adenylyltransferase [Treponemataceae bacterium]